MIHTNLSQAESTLQTERDQAPEQALQLSATMRQLDRDELRAVVGGPVTQVPEK